MGLKKKGPDLDLVISQNVSEGSYKYVCMYVNMYDTAIAGLPTLTDLPWVSQFENGSHVLTDQADLTISARQLVVDWI